jgi:hypothetical protein
VTGDLRTRALAALAALEERQVDDAYAEHEQLAAEAVVAAAAVLGVSSEPSDWASAAQLGVEARLVVDGDLVLSYRLVGLPGHPERDARLYLVDPSGELLQVTDLARLGVWLQYLEQTAAIDDANGDGEPF